MTDPTASPPEKQSTTADKMLASLRRGTDMPPDRLAGLSGPVQRETPAKKRQGGEPKMQPASVARSCDFDVSTGRGIKHLTVRVPKEMAADLALLAMRNKLSENGEPTTINELGIKAFRSMLDAAA